MYSCYCCYCEESFFHPNKRSVVCGTCLLQNKCLGSSEIHNLQGGICINCGIVFYYPGWGEPLVINKEDDKN